MQFFVNGQQVHGSPFGGIPMAPPRAVEVMGVPSFKRIESSDETIVPTAEWSADDMELLSSKLVCDHLLERLTQSLGKQIARVSRRSIRVTPRSRPQQLLIRIACKFTTIELTLVQEGA